MRTRRCPYIPYIGLSVPLTCNNSRPAPGGEVALASAGDDQAPVATRPATDHVTRPRDQVTWSCPATDHVTSAIVGSIASPERRTGPGLARHSWRTAGAATFNLARPNEAQRAGQQLEGQKLPLVVGRRLKAYVCVRLAHPPRNQPGQKGQSQPSRSVSAWSRPATATRETEVRVGTARVVAARTAHVRIDEQETVTTAPSAGPRRQGA